MPTIQDGTGKGFQAQVDDNNRLRVESVSESDEHRKALDGDAYSINSSTTANLLTITTTVGAVLHLQNDSSSSLFDVCAFVSWVTLLALPSPRLTGWR